MLTRTSICNFLITLLLLTFSAPVIASSSEKSGGFQADAYIIDHIVDSYGWHITTYKNTEISIPLPIILFDNGKLVCFMSSKFHHGKNSYNGYALGFTPETKGKIVKLEAQDEGFTGHLETEKNYSYSTVFLDISISKNVCSLFISIIFLLWIFLSMARAYKRNQRKAPQGMQALLEPVVLFIRDEIARPLIGDHKYQKYLPYLLTLFFFILINNLLGLFPVFPGGANVTGNIAITLTLAIITFLITSLSGNKQYWMHIINPPGVPWWLKFPLPLLPVIELIGVLTKPFVLMIRLFANIVAGHIIILGFLGLIFIFGQMSTIGGFAVSPLSLFFYIFMGIIELLVAFIQAFVFTLLTSLYIGMAIEEHHA